MTLINTLFKVSSYFILSSAFSLFKKFEKLSSIDEVSQVHLSMSELNNKYREIDPELDEFSQNAIKTDYRKTSQKNWTLETEPIYIHDPSFF